METTIGVERERFICDSRGKIVPEIGNLLPIVLEVARSFELTDYLFGYELYAGQIEDRTFPCRSLEELRLVLEINDRILQEAAFLCGLDYDFSEFAKDLTVGEFDVNPFNERHQNIWRVIPPERRLAASQVAAVHVHLVVTIEQAVRLFRFCDNGIVENLIELGDHSDGRRLKAYRTMTQSDSIPPKFSGPAELLEYIKEHGGERNVWDLIRYKPTTGTIEFRMFGMTKGREEIIRYAEACLVVLQEALKQ